jgi:hypothetical protein
MRANKTEKWPSTNVGIVEGWRPFAYMAEVILDHLEPFCMHAYSFGGRIFLFTLFLAFTSCGLT